MFVCAEREVGSGVCMHSCVCVCVCTHTVGGFGGSSGGVFVCVCVCARACACARTHVCVCVCMFFCAHEYPCMPSLWVVRSQHCSLEVSIYVMGSQKKVQKVLF